MANKPTAAHTPRHCPDVGRRLRSALIVALAIGVLLDVGAGPALAASTHPYNQGCEALARGDIDKAKALFQEAVKLDPSDTDALNNLAVCFIETGDYDHALPLLQRVLRLNPRYAGADLNIGSAYIFQDDLAKGQPPTERAQRAGATAVGAKVEAAAYYNLGLIAARQGRWEDAKAAFLQSLKAESTTAARIGLGSALCALGDLSAGLPMLEKVSPGSGDPDAATTLGANLAAAYYQRGMATLTTGNLADADEDFTRSSQAAPNDYASLGHALVDAERGKRSAAAALLTRMEGSASSPAVRSAARADLDRLTAVADHESQWLKWLVMAAGAIVLFLQSYVLAAALVGSPRRNAGLVMMVVVGVLVGLGLAVFLGLEYFDPLRAPRWVALALAADAVVLVIVWLSTRGGAKPAKTKVA